MNVITGIKSTGSALNAEKVRMDIVAQNIANAHTTRDVDGNPYKRKVVSFEAVLGSERGTSGGVRVSGITNDNREGETIYNPQHPHADKDGVVAADQAAIGAVFAGAQAVEELWRVERAVVHAGCGPCNHVWRNILGGGA